MGKHRDATSLAFINILKERGQSNGFLVKEEYPLIKGLYYADLVWILPCDDRPVFSFEIESRSTGYLMKNAMKYFSTSSKEIPKPWHHFILVIKGEINLGERKLVKYELDRHNVHIFEDIMKTDNYEHFSRLLEKITRGFRQKERYVPQEYKEEVLKQAKTCADLMYSKSREEARVELAKIQSLIKGKIETWDGDSVRFSIKELFLKLFGSTPFEETIEMDDTFGAIFDFAYSQGNRMICSITEAFEDILDESEKHEYSVEMADKVSGLLLGFALRYLSKDISITEECLRVIDNATEDLLYPELMSKEILLAGFLYQLVSDRPTKEITDLFKRATACIEYNYKDSSMKALLEDSMRYAEKEQSKYRVDSSRYSEKFLVPFLMKEIENDMNGLIKFLKDQLEGDDTSIDFVSYEIAEMILAYEYITPDIAIRIRKEIVDTNDLRLLRIFKQAVGKSKLLKKIFEGSDMLTTFQELIRFLEMNSDTDNQRVGITTYGPSWTDFKNNLTDEQKRAIQDVCKEYNLLEDGEFELGDNNLTFLVDTLVYRGNGYRGYETYDMPKLIDFLKQINEIADIENFTTGVEFKLRHVSKEPTKE